MENKETIIDGIDVSGCEYLDNIDFDELCLMLSSPYECQVNCSNKPNCYYKQLLRKNQECEELKNKIEFMEEYIKTVENSRNEFEKESKFLKEENTEIRKYQYEQDFLQQQLDQLKTENDELRKERNKFKKQYNKNRLDRKQAEQKLNKMREYCKYITAFNNTNKTNKGLNVDEVIQIIDEVK